MHVVASSPKSSIPIQLLLSSLVPLLLLALPVQAEVLVPPCSTWKWLHPTDGVDPATDDEDFHETFFLDSFDDSAWNEDRDSCGPHGGFGYGDPNFTGIDLGQPEAIEDRNSAYFRIKFRTLHAYDRVELTCQRDDGLIVYLDGKEVGRDNVDAEAEDAYALKAERTIGGEAERTVVTIPLEGPVAAGEHLLAISLHNRAAGSSDLRLAEITLRSASESELTDEGEGEGEE
jgi:hypothetical protein